MNTVLGSAMSEQVDAAVLEELCKGVRSWVESKRSDLFGEDDAGQPAFLVTESVRLGAAMLVWRLYKRRETPLGILGATEDGYTGIVREDPDIARLLGIGSAGRFVFGGHNPTTSLEGGAG